MVGMRFGSSKDSGRFIPAARVLMSAASACWFIDDEFEGGAIIWRCEDLMYHDSMFLKRRYAAIEAKAIGKSKSPLLSFGVIVGEQTSFIRSVVQFDNIVV
jgi:hypothetical protein